MLVFGRRWDIGALHTSIIAVSDMIAAFSERQVTLASPLRKHGPEAGPCLQNTMSEATLPAPPVSPTPLGLQTYRFQDRKYSQSYN